MQCRRFSSIPVQAGAAHRAVRRRLLDRHRRAHRGAAARPDARPAGAGREPARADGQIAAEHVAKSAPDGQTLLLSTNSPHSAAPHLKKKLPYDPFADFTPISFVGRYTFFIVVHPTVPAKTLADFIGHARANPGKLNYGTGNTSSIVLTGMFLAVNGLQLVHVPYKTEPTAIPDFLQGQVQLMISSYATVAPHIRDGKLRALATTLDRRSPLLPDVPAITETGMAKFPIVSWAGLFGPAKLPKTSSTG